MNAKNADVWQALGALRDLNKVVWPVKTAYALAKLTRKVTEAYQDVETTRNGLVTKYGKPNAQGMAEVSKDGPEFGQFLIDFNDLLREEVEIEAGPVELDLAQANGQAIKPETLLLLGPFVEVKE